MNISLSKFCKDRGLPKTSVYERCKELKLDVAAGLTPGMVAQLENEFDVTSPTRPIAPDVLPENFFKGSELAAVDRREIQLPQGFDPTAMVRYFDGVAGSSTDTDSLLAIADMAIGAVVNVMDAKLEEQRQNLKKAEQDAKKLETKVAEAKTQLQIKALESKILAERQTSVTQTAEQTFANLMSMGKVQDSGQSSS